MEIPQSYMNALPFQAKRVLGDRMYQQLEDCPPPYLTWLKLYISAPKSRGSSNLLTKISSKKRLQVEGKEEERDGSTAKEVEESGTARDQQKLLLSLANKLETSLHIWKKKERFVRHHSEGTEAGKKRLSRLAQRVKRVSVILTQLQEMSPPLRHTDLAILKIQSNRDVGLSVLEAYSRVLESLAARVCERIEAVLFAHEQAVLQANKETQNSAAPIMSIENESLSSSTVGDLLNFNELPSHVDPLPDFNSLFDMSAN